MSTLYCPGIYTMAGFCPECEEGDDGISRPVLYILRKEAEISIAGTAKAYIDQVMKGERAWDDAKSMIESMGIVDVEIDEGGAAIALDSREGCEGCYEEIDYGYLNETPEPDSIMEGCLGNKGEYIINKEES